MKKQISIIYIILISILSVILTISMIKYMKVSINDPWSTVIVDIGIILCMVVSVIMIIFEILKLLEKYIANKRRKR